MGVRGGGVNSGVLNNYLIYGIVNLFENSGLGVSVYKCTVLSILDLWLLSQLCNAINFGYYDGVYGQIQRCLR